MGKKNRTETSIRKVSPGFLGQYVEEDKSLDTLRQHVEVPRAKIIQNVTDRTLKEMFGEGSVITRPGDVLVCTKDDSFTIVPLFFCVEYCKWADIRDTSGFAITARSFLPDSLLAMRAKDPDKRFQIYEGQEANEKPMKWRYVEHLRFISIIYGEHELVGIPLTISFERGEHRQGKNFISAISMRRETIDGTPRPVPLWAQVWTLSPTFREPDADRKWWGFNYSPADPPVIDEEDAESMRLRHNEFREAFERNLLLVQDSDREAGEEQSTDDM